MSLVDRLRSWLATWIGATRILFASCGMWVAGKREGHLRLMLFRLCAPLVQDVRLTETVVRREVCGQLDTDVANGDSEEAPKRSDRLLKYVAALRTANCAYLELRVDGIDLCVFPRDDALIIRRT